MAERPKIYLNGHLSMEHTVTREAESLISDVVDSITRSYRAAEETRLRRLVDLGVATNRISQITKQHCAECHGRGSVWVYERIGHDVSPRDRSLRITLRECHQCPGLCVDGKPVVLWEKRDGPLAKLAGTEP